MDIKSGYHKQYALRIVIIVTAFIIVIPAIVILTWSFTAKWPWPELLPEKWSLRTIKIMFSGNDPLIPILGSSILLGIIVAALATIVALMTAQATEICHVKGRKLIRFAEFMPMLVPGTVFAMGFQVVLIRMGLNDTLRGVVIVHLVCGLPYAYAIMTDLTSAIGDSLEEQAQVLGASPFKAFFQVTLPQLIPGILSTFSMSFIISYSQYFTTLLAGGGEIKTIALILIPYIQSGDRALSSVYSLAFVVTALLIFALFEYIVKKTQLTEPQRTM